MGQSGEAQQGNSALLNRSNPKNSSPTIATTQNDANFNELLSPILAETIAKAGWTKHEVKRYFFEHARLPASKFEHFLREWTVKGTWNLEQAVKEGRMPKLFAE